MSSLFCKNDTAKNNIIFCVAKAQEKGYMRYAANPIGYNIRHNYISVVFMLLLKAYCIL